VCARAQNVPFKCLFKKILKRYEVYNKRYEEIREKDISGKC